MKPPGFVKGTAFFAIAVALLFVSAFPVSTTSHYEVENCQSSCRVVFDPVLSPTEYATCMEQCKRHMMNKPQL